MWWKLKAAIHQSISLLPERLSYSANFFLQRHFGRLAEADSSLEHLNAGRRYAESIERMGRSLGGKTILEIGTGRHLDLSIALWLCGAGQIITTDINPYLQTDLILEHLKHLKEDRENVRSLFGAYADTPLFRERFIELLALPQSLQALLDLTKIMYHAPANSAHLALPTGSVDYYISYGVMQYISPELLEDVLWEGLRVLKPDGLHLHAIDLTDWFATSDPTISTINFLRFSEREWRKYAGNRYMYQNRMRIDDYSELLTRLGYRIRKLDATIDPRAIRTLKSGFPLDKRFYDKPIETNATSSAWIIASSAAAP